MIDIYKNLKKELTGLMSGERDFIANASNFAALLFQRLKGLNWVGFYFVTGNELLLGPFQGKPACIRIQIGNGVCGKSAADRKTLIVPNVHEFPGHIACDAASNSEIVIPMIYQDNVFGVLDIDSPAFDRFWEDDKKGIEELITILINSSDIEPVLEYYKN